MHIMCTRAAILVALASACGTPSPRSATELPQPDPVATESTIAVPEPLVQISLVIRDVAGLMLFEDEQLEAANIIAAWAKTTNLVVVPPARTREILRRAADGQNAVTGKACGGPMWALPALERWREELRADGRVEAIVACLPGCILAVTVSEGLDIAARDAGRTALWTAPYDPSQPWRAELARRLTELAPMEIGPDVAAQTAGAAPRPTAVDPAFASADEEALPAASAAPAQACLGDAGAIGLVLETDASGHVARCESFSGRIVANGPVARCACAALGGAALGGGARRLVTTLSLPPAASVVTTRAGKVLDARVRQALRRDAGTGLYVPIASNGSVREWEPPMPWQVAACFVDLAPGAPAIEARVTIAIDGKTAAASVTGVQVTTGTLTPAQTACASDVIARATRVPCPAPGMHTVTGVLVVQQRDP